VTCFGLFDWLFSGSNIFSFMYTALLPDDGQSNRLKHVVEI